MTMTQNLISQSMDQNKQQQKEKVDRKYAHLLNAHLSSECNYQTF